MDNSFFCKQQTVNCNGKLINFEKPKVMGILNATPDSFFEASRISQPNDFLNKINSWIECGVDMIDIGAYSSRPGAKHISENEEWKRLSKVLEEVREHFPDLIISVDTFRSEVARLSIEHFAVDIINDISAGQMDEAMFGVVGQKSVAYIMMHMLGTPQTMQTNPNYAFLLKEIFSLFAERIALARDAGVKDIIIDPGFGFGKTIDHNFELLNRLDEFKIFEMPILVGVSRKTMIYKLLDSSPEEALNGTTILNTLALTKGANILRVHDVKEAKEAVLLYNKMNEFDA